MNEGVERNEGMEMNEEMESRIRRRAYLLWERENCPEGKHLDHWFAAKAEIEAGQDAESVADEEPAAKESQPEPARRR